MIFGCFVLKITARGSWRIGITHAIGKKIHSPVEMIKSNFLIAELFKYIIFGFYYYIAQNVVNKGRATM